MIRKQIDTRCGTPSHSDPSARTDRPSILFIGDAAHRDFRSVVATLRCEALLRQVFPASLARDESTLPPVDSPPHLVLFAQSYPGEVDPAWAVPFRRRYPLAPAILLLGTWCEGYGRTGESHTGLMRLYWHEFPGWWKRQTSLLKSGRCPDWAQPAPDRVGAGAEPMERTMQERVRPLVVLHTSRWDTADALAMALLRAGFATVWQRPGRPRPVIHGAAAAIWEGGQLDEGEAHELENLCHQLGSATPVIGLVDFPRLEHLELASQLGVSSLLGKPWIASELVSTLHDLLKRRIARDDAAAA